MARLYTLFSRSRGSKRWIDCGGPRYYKPTAILVYQDRLLYPFLTGDISVEYCLRPVQR